jgi:hypothetical protein
MAFSPERGVGEQAPKGLIDKRAVVITFGQTVSPLQAAYARTRR